MPYAIDIQHAFPDRQRFAEAFLRGQACRSTIATTLFRDKIEQPKA